MKKTVRKGKKVIETQDTNPSYTEFNVGIFNKHKHFKDYFIVDPKDTTLFICTPCKTSDLSNSSGQYDYIDRHIGADFHFISIPKDDLKDIPEALKAFKEFRKNKKIELIDPETEKKIRIEYTNFLIQHQLPFSLAPEIVKFNQYLLTKYGANSISVTGLSNTTCGQISRQCISKNIKEEIYSDLKKSVFSLSFDESADRLGPVFLCTHVRYIKENQIQHKLLALQE